MGGSLMVVNPYSTPVSIPAGLPIAHSMTPVGIHPTGPQGTIQAGPVGQHPTTPQGQAYYAQRMKEIQAAQLAEALRQQQAQAWETQQAQALAQSGGNQSTYFGE